MCYLAIFLALCVLWYSLHRLGAHFIFRPHKKRWHLTLPFQNVWLAPQLSGAYLPASQGNPTFVFFHGRGGNISHFENFAKTYAALGYGILMVDYPGFGLSAGSPSQAWIEQAALATVNYALNHLKLPLQQVVLYGHSLGNYPALFVAQHYKKLPLKALILQSPFLSTPDTTATWAAHGYWPHTLRYQLVRTFVTPFLLGNCFNNTRQVGGLSVPTLVCMSKTDTILPWQASAKLADQLPHAKRLLAPLGGHDEFKWAAAAVHSFLQQLPH